MKALVKTATTFAAMMVIVGTASTAFAGGTIASGPYETVCDKNPTACGSDVKLPPRPKPKPPKPSSYTPISWGWNIVAPNNIIAPNN